MPDLVSARFGEIEDVSDTAEFAEIGRLEILDKRGGRWLLDHDLPTEPAVDRHTAALANQDRCLIVGQIDDVVVGHVLAYISPATTGSLCMIEELFVHPEARAIGVGSAMLDRVRSWAVENGCSALESHVLPGNREGKNFFERLGMKTRKMRVSTDL